MHEVDKSDRLITDSSLDEDHKNESYSPENKDEKTY